MATDTIDFQAVKEAVRIEDVVPKLDLPRLQRHGEQFRAPCPTCKNGGDRALVITPSKGAYYCFSAKRGGDVIALVAHTKGISQRDAAEWLSEQYRLGNSRTDSRNGSRNSTRNSTSGEGTGSREAGPLAAKAIDPLTYLEPEHELIQALGVSTDTAEHFGGGYAGRGVLRGRFALPIHAIDGTLIAYVGIAVKEDQQPRLLFHNFRPESYLFGLHRVSIDMPVYVARDPLDVLIAHENGVDNVVSFLSPITADALQVLSLWMDEKGIESVEVMA